MSRFKPAALFAPLVAIGLVAGGEPGGHAQAPSAPLADHHQHLFSPALSALMSPAAPAPAAAPIDAAYLIARLDEAGIRRAVVLSTAYIWSQPSRKVEDDAARVRADNDWTSQEVARYPDRLIGFCGISPVRSYALAELARCAADPRLRTGVKLHFGNAGLDYHDPAQVTQVRQVFEAANRYKMAIVVHMRASFTEKRAYGAEEARIFLDQLASGAPDVPIQIAHLAGAGGYDDRAADEALAVFVEAIRRNDPRASRLWFDVTAVALPGQGDDVRALIARRIREVGLQRVLYGTDAAVAGNTPAAGWRNFRQLPLTDAEFAAIAGNVPPYLTAP